MIANASTVITQQSTCTFVAVALGKEVYTNLSKEELQRLMPMQNGGQSSERIVEICKRVLHTPMLVLQQIRRGLASTAEVGESGYKMRTFTQITISFEDQPCGNIAIPRMKLIINNMIGAFLILIIALTLIVTLLLPNVLDAIQYAMLSPGIVERILVLADLLLLGFLIAVPTTFLIWSLLGLSSSARTLPGWVL